MKRKSAFTLVEMLIVTLILAVVTTAIAACLSGGMRAWESVRNFNDVELNVLPALELMEKDVRNSFDFYRIEFAGEEKSLSFAGPVVVGGPDGQEYRIGTIKYFFDERDEVVARKEWIYPEDEPDEYESVMTGINDVLFEYCYEGADTEEGWESFRTSGTNAMHGLRLTLACGRGRQADVITRTIILPVARVQKFQNEGMTGQ